MAYKTEVQADDTGTWAGNALVFATHAEADQYAADLAWRWTLVREWRVVETDAPVTHGWVDGVLEVLQP